MSITRYNDIVIETQGDTSFEITTNFTGKTKIKIKGAQYTTPPIPNGYMYVEGHWYNGFVIERISDESRFVWIPVGYLDNDGTLDEGKTFKSKFGRRNYLLESRSDLFYEKNHHGIAFEEVIDDSFKAQMESIEKYGGFYISQFLICQSISKGEEKYLSHWRDWNNYRHRCHCKYEDAVKKALLVENTMEVKSHLIYASEYDSMMAWLVKSQRVTLKQITERNPHYTVIATDGMFVYNDGGINELKLNNIYDISEDDGEWTQERFKDQYYISRGGRRGQAIFERNIEGLPIDDCQPRHYISRGKRREYRIFSRNNVEIPTIRGFRVALWIE